MSGARLDRLFDPQSRATGARVCRAVHHVMLAAGIGIMFVDTVAPWRQSEADALDTGFWIVCTFFFAEYVQDALVMGDGRRPPVEIAQASRARHLPKCSARGAPDAAVSRSMRP